MISTPFDGTTNPIFVALFNYLGILPAINTCLLLPGSKDQKPLPAIPFIVSSFALGFFGIGPYLGSRTLKTYGVTEGNGFGIKLFESKKISIGMLAFALYLTSFCFKGIVDSDMSAVNDFITLFNQQRLVHVSTIDFTILSLSVWDPLREDMSRRYTPGTNPLPAWVYCIVPVLVTYSALITI